MNDGSDWWESLGMGLVIVAGIAGLVFLAMIVLSVVAMGSFGSNK